MYRTDAFYTVTFRYVFFFPCSIPVKTPCGHDGAIMCLMDVEDLVGERVSKLDDKDMTTGKREWEGCI